MSFGEEERSSEVETPLAGLTVLLSGEEGDVTAEVVDGKKPEDEKAFEKQKLALFVDGVLPAKDVEDGATVRVGLADSSTVEVSADGIDPVAPMDAAVTPEAAAGRLRGLAA